MRVQRLLIVHHTQVFALVDLEPPESLSNHAGEKRGLRLRTHGSRSIDVASQRSAQLEKVIA